MVNRSSKCASLSSCRMCRLVRLRAVLVGGSNLVAMFLIPIGKVLAPLLYIEDGGRGTVSRVREKVSRLLLVVSRSAWLPSAAQEPRRARNDKQEARCDR